MRNSKISMQVPIVVNVINGIGDALFIFGFHWVAAGCGWGLDGEESLLLYTV